MLWRELIPWRHISVDGIAYTRPPTLWGNITCIKRKSLAGRIRLSNWHTFGSVSKYDNGTCISERILLLISMAILWIWLAWSLFCCSSRCMRSDSPESGTHGSGNHHLSSLRWNDFLLSLKDWFLWSAYQNSGLWKLSNIPYRKKFSHTLYITVPEWIVWRGLCESRLTRSMVSSFSSAGRFIRMSDLGEVAITCWNKKNESQSWCHEVRLNTSRFEMSDDLMALHHVCFHQAWFGRSVRIRQCIHK
jgi:hypothetical protein